MGSIAPPLPRNRQSQDARAIKAGWTSERVERLKALNAKGLSAAQIAAQLGGVSRMAVIGKLRRLGVQMMSASAPAKPRPAKAKAVKAPPAPTLPIQPEPVTGAAFHIQRERPEPLPPEPQVALAPPPPDADATCNWPIGDPRLPSFRFCGAPSVRDDRGRCYCEAHRQAAFTTPPAKSPRTANELARSLRRYIA